LVDCIPLDQQPGLRPPGRPRVQLSRDIPRIAAAGSQLLRGESRLPGERRGEDITLKSGQRDRLGNEMFCQSETIPLVRLTLERVAAFRTLAAFLSKDDDEKDPNRPADDSNHYYARGVQFVDSLGGDSWLNVWNP